MLPVHGTRKNSSIERNNLIDYQFSKSFKSVRRKLMGAGREMCSE